MLQEKLYSASNDDVKLKDLKDVKDVINLT